MKPKTAEELKELIIAEYGEPVSVDVFKMGDSWDARFASSSASTETLKRFLKVVDKLRSLYSLNEETAR